METAQVIVTARQRKALAELVGASRTPQGLASRCRVVLLSAEGIDNCKQALQLMMDRQRVRRWRRRWAAAFPELQLLEGEDVTDAELTSRIVEVLGDRARSGKPPKFSPEQIAAVIALACEPPADSGLPISHWTPQELATEAIKRGIVPSISARQVDRFLSRWTFDPTRAVTG